MFDVDLSQCRVSEWNRRSVVLGLLAISQDYLISIAKSTTNIYHYRQNIAHQITGKSLSRGWRHTTLYFRSWLRKLKINQPEMQTLEKKTLWKKRNHVKHSEPCGAKWTMWSKVKHVKQSEPCGAKWSKVKQVEQSEACEAKWTMWSKVKHVKLHPNPVVWYWWLFGRTFNHSFPAWAFFFKVEISSRALIALFMPELVHSGSAVRRLWPNVPWQVACDLVSG